MAESEKSTNHVLKKFDESRDALLKKIEASVELETEALSSHFDDVSTDLQRIQKMVADSASLLPAYDLKKCQESMKMVERTLHEKMDALIPRKKFAFKSNRKKASETVQVVPDKPIPSTIRTNTNECGFSHKQNCKLELNEDQLEGGDVLLDNLVDCQVYVYGNPSTIHATDVKNCKIYTGPVSTSIFVEKCVHTEFHVACQQLRIHESRDCAFYLHVTSKAIIENCKGMVFSVYDWNYDGLETHYTKSGLNRLVNNWDKVDDFDWLAVDQPSPNWIAK